MRLIVDASVAVKWVIEEDGHQAARRLLSSDHELLAPDFLLVETASVLWKKLRRKELSTDQAHAGVKAVQWPLARLIKTDALVPRALRLGIDLDHSIYDCLYLAAAEVEQGRVVTSDGRFFRTLANTPYASHAVLLGEMK